LIQPVPIIARLRGQNRPKRASTLQVARLRFSDEKIDRAGWRARRRHARGRTLDPARGLRRPRRAIAALLTRSRIALARSVCAGGVD
jgi:hypothetical protein